MITEKEEWLPAPDGWGDRYLVSNMGRVMSIRPPNRGAIRKFKTPAKDKRYKQIEFTQGRRNAKESRKGYESKNWLVHRLVMATFRPEIYSEELEVHHLNMDPSDNRLENLLVITPDDHEALHMVFEQLKRAAMVEAVSRYHDLNSLGSLERVDAKGG